MQDFKRFPFTGPRGWAQKPAAARAALPVLSLNNGKLHQKL